MNPDFTTLGEYSPVNVLSERTLNEYWLARAAGPLYFHDLLGKGACLNTPFYLGFYASQSREAEQQSITENGIRISKARQKSLPNYFDRVLAQVKVGVTRGQNVKLTIIVFRR